MNNGKGMLCEIYNYYNMTSDVLCTCVTHALTITTILCMQL